MSRIRIRCARCNGKGHEHIRVQTRHVIRGRSRKLNRQMLKLCIACTGAGTVCLAEARRRNWVHRVGVAR